MIFFGVLCHFSFPRHFSFLLSCFRDCCHLTPSPFQIVLPTSDHRFFLDSCCFRSSCRICPTSSFSDCRVCSHSKMSGFWKLWVMIPVMVMLATVMPISNLECSAMSSHMQSTLPAAPPQSPPPLNRRGTPVVQVLLVWTDEGVMNQIESPQIYFQHSVFKDTLHTLKEQINGHKSNHRLREF